MIPKPLHGWNGNVMTDEGAMLGISSLTFPYHQTISMILISEHDPEHLFWRSFHQEQPLTSQTNERSSH